MHITPKLFDIVLSCQSGKTGATFNVQNSRLKHLAQSSQKTSDTYTLIIWNNSKILGVVYVLPHLRLLFLQMSYHVQEEPKLNSMNTKVKSIEE